MAHISDTFGDERLKPMTPEEINELARKCIEASSNSDIRVLPIELPQNRTEKIAPDFSGKKRTRVNRLRDWLDEKI